jgi:hypothetical protein
MSPHLIMRYSHKSSRLKGVGSSQTQKWECSGTVNIHTHGDSESFAGVVGTGSLKSLDLLSDRVKITHFEIRGNGRLAGPVMPGHAKAKLLSFQEKSTMKLKMVSLVPSFRKSENPRRNGGEKRPSVIIGPTPPKLGPRGSLGGVGQ